LKVATEKPGHDLATEQMADEECETGNPLAGLSGASAKKWELNRFGGGILLSEVFFDLTQFNFHGLLFSQ
jgi:hypothetical protein